MVLYLARRQCGLSLRELGKITGGTDYAAIRIAVKRFSKKVDQDRNLTLTVNKAIRMLNVET